MLHLPIRCGFQQPFAFGKIDTFFYVYRYQWHAVLHRKPLNRAKANLPQ
jgi:hypothetical protein